MKTLITVGNDTYLLPTTADIAKVIELMRGLRRVQSETIYGGPSDEERWKDECGYRNANVVEARTERLRVEVVDDKDLVERAEWDTLKAATAEKIEAKRKALPKAA